MYKGADVYAKLKYARTSVKKGRPVAELIRGKDVTSAKVLLAFHQSKVAKIFLKVLKSAEANAINNSKLSKADLYVADAQIYPGPIMKRARIVARSRTNPIQKKTSHVVVGLSGRDRKGKK
ncbi:MAG TPA: 50S ribosomal protein L22 [candidate division WWE3 bacterium]|uniref:Large ribosomal subunit protein uL22 n=1 Tax=candidate division WWE3 bacterium TaxID=2053526 RepID=A0A7C1DI93_UNCKA|nr:50S ribosomal protein L22 [candidate division WWE3 bacterium]